MRLVPSQEQTGRPWVAAPQLQLGPLRSRHPFAFHYPSTSFSIPHPSIAQLHSMASSTRPAHSSHHSHGPPPSSNGYGPGSSVLTQKSHVVAGVQDAYWTDDEEVRYHLILSLELLLTFRPFLSSFFISLCGRVWVTQEVLECPLCVGEMEDDMNFKPCPCGYQVRLFIFPSFPFRHGRC